MKPARIAAIKADFIHGAQYYRYPTQHPEDWLADLEHLRRLGLDTIKVTAYWGVMERREGEYWWRDVDGVMDAAQANGVRVILNLLFDNVPTWVARKHSPYAILNEDPTVREQRIFGGPTADWDNPGVLADGERFLRQLVRRYRGHPALLMWDAWEEAKYHPARNQYSDAAFARYLLDRYGSLEAVNERLGESYGAPEDISLELSRFHLSGQIERNRFQNRRVDSLVRWVYEIMAAEDPDMPILVHTHSWGTVNACANMWDDWTLSRTCDLYACSTHIIYYYHAHRRFADFSRIVANFESKRQQGYYFVNEMPTGLIQTGDWTTLDKAEPGEVLFNDLTALAHGARGVVYWQFRPERVTHEAGGWGLIAMDGSDTHCSEDAARFTAFERANHDLLAAARLPQPEVGLYFSQESGVVSAALDHSGYTDAFTGAAFALYANNLPFDILRDGDDFAPYTHLWLPAAHCLPDATVDKLLAFVRQGGTLVLEGMAGMFDDLAWHRIHVPGDRLALESGLAQADLERPRSYAYDEPWSGLRAEGIRVATKGHDQVLAAACGVPLVVAKRYGAGRIVWVTCPTAAACLRDNDAAAARRLLQLLAIPVRHDWPRQGNVTWRLLATAAGEQVAFVFNHDSCEASVTPPPSLLAGRCLVSNHDAPPVLVEGRL
ncbi:MAG: beta-galactosidase, partial [Anaerolineae bacterium]